MRLSKFITILITITIVALLYVKQQVEAVKLGYQINKQQAALADTLDQRQMLLYNLLNQESPQNLQHTLYKKSNNKEDFKMLAGKQVIVLTKSKTKSNSVRAVKKEPSGWTKFFKITSLAEAKQ